MTKARAGTLEIELIANVARLQKDMRDAQRAIAGMTGEAQASAGRADRSFGQWAQSIERTGKSGKLAGHHMQNLAFQFQDLGIQMAMAAQSGAPLRMMFMALLQQGSQIQGVMSQAGIGVKGLAGEVTGAVAGFARARPFLVAGAAAAAAMAIALKLAAIEVGRDRKAEIDAYVASLGLTEKQMKKLGDTSITMGDALRGTSKTIVDEFGLAMPEAVLKFWGVLKSVFAAVPELMRTGGAAIYSAFVGGFRAVAEVWRGLPALLGEATYGAANFVIRGLNQLLRTAADYVNRFSDLVNQALAKIPGFDVRLGKVQATQLAELGNPFAGSAARIARGAVSEFGKAYDEARAGMTRIGQRGADNIVDAAKARLGATAREIIDADSKAGKAAKAAAGRAGKAAGEEFAALFRSSRERMEQAFVDLTKGTQAALEGIVDAGLDGLYADVARSGKTILDHAERTGEAWARQREDMESFLSMARDIASLGGVGGAIGGAMGALRGDFGGLSPQLATLARGVMGIGWKDDAGQFRTLGDRIEDIFRTNKTFAKTMTAVLQGAGTGLAVAQLTGNGSTGSQLGGALGGAAGQGLVGSFSAKFASSTAGAVLGAVVPVVGGIIGSLLGGLFSKAKTGSASVASGAISLSGNNADARANSNSLAGKIGQSLQSIADAFGGGLGSYGYTIGSRKDEFRVSGSAGANVTSKNPGGLLYRGKDPEEAARIALRDAIMDGAIAGMTATEKAIALAGSDIERQVQRALTFRGAMDELRRRTDPTAFELEQLGKEIDKLREIAAEGGASIEELAKIAELEALRRKDILDEAAARALETLNEQRALEVRLLEAQGKTLEALALSREIELSQAKAGDRAKLAEIHAAEDAARALDRTRASRALEIELLRAMGRESEATALARLAELDGLDAAQRELKRATWAWNDAAEALAAASDKVGKAKDALSSAYQREAGELGDLVARWRSVADGLRQFRGSLTASPDGQPGYSQALIDYLRVAGGARAGNEADLGALQASSQTFLSAALANAGSSQQYARAVAMVRRDVDAAIAAAGGQASAAEAQLAELRRTVGALIEIEEGQQGVAAAIAALRLAQAEEAEAQASRDALTDPVPQLVELTARGEAQTEAIDALGEEMARNRREIASLRGDMLPVLLALRGDTAKLASIHSSWDGGAAIKVMTAGDVLAVDQV